MKMHNEYMSAVRGMISPRATNAKLFARRPKGALCAAGQRGWDAAKGKGAVSVEDKTCCAFLAGRSHYLSLQDAAATGYSWAKVLIQA